MTAGKTLLVFGARHLGGTLASELAAQEWNVAAVALSEETIGLFRERLPDGLGIVGDAAAADDVEHAFGETRKRFGPIDLVVNAISLAQTVLALVGL